MRVKRGTGRKGEEGTCGVAKSPSVALGGELLAESGIAAGETINNVDHEMQTLQRMETSFENSYCDSLGLDDYWLCDRVEW